MKYSIVALALIAMAVTGCHRKSDYDAVFKNPSSSSKTVYQLNTVVMGNNFSPIVASRNYTYANIAAYEVIAGGYPDKYQSLAGQLKGLKSVPARDTTKQIDVEFAALLAFCNVTKSRPTSGLDDQE